MIQHSALPQVWAVEGVGCRSVPRVTRSATIGPGIRSRPASNWMGRGPAGWRCAARWPGPARRGPRSRCGCRPDLAAHDRGPDGLHAGHVQEGEQERAGPPGRPDLGLHGWAVPPVVFLAPALKASAFVGLVIPGEIAVLLGGVLEALRHRRSGLDPLAGRPAQPGRVCCPHERLDQPDLPAAQAARAAGRDPRAAHPGCPGRPVRDHPLGRGCGRAWPTRS